MHWGWCLTKHRWARGNANIGEGTGACAWQFHRPLREHKRSLLLTLINYIKLHKNTGPNDSWPQCGQLLFSHTHFHVIRDLFSFFKNHLPLIIISSLYGAQYSPPGLYSQPLFMLNLILPWQQCQLKLL